MVVPIVRALLGAIAVAAAGSGAGQGTADPAPAPDPSDPPPAAAEPPKPPAAPASRPSAPPARRGWRPPVVPRYLGGGFTYGKVSSPAPGIGTRDGRGWNMVMEWELAPWLDAQFRGGATRVRVGWTPNPSDTNSPAELGLVGIGALVRLRPGRRVDPWIGADLAYQGVLWDDYLHSVTDWGPLASAGVDLHVFRWGAVRLAASYGSFTATTKSGNGPTGPTPGPQDDGARASMKTLWVTAAWLFDLGPASP